MKTPWPPLGLIAGSGGLPLELLRGARRAGRPVHVVAIKSLASPSLARFATSLDWIRLGALGALLSSLKKAGVREAVMQGQVKLKSVFSAMPDFLGARVLAGLKVRSGEAILRAIGGVLSQNGIRLLDGRTHMQSVLAGKGLLAGRALSKGSRADLRLGFRTARFLSRMEAGQTVVVKNGVIVALEGLEGTDACLNRASAIAGRGCVAVKVASARGDFRFDIPTLGPRTLGILRTGGYKALGLESGRTFILDREGFLSRAHQAEITVWGV